MVASPYPSTKGLLGDILDDDDDCLLLPSSHKERSPVEVTGGVTEKTVEKAGIIVQPTECMTTGSNNEEAAPVKKIICQFSAQRMQKRKRWADGILIVHEGAPSLALESADDEGCIVDTVRWTKIIRDKWQTAMKNEQDLTLDSSRHLIRIDADAWSSCGPTLPKPCSGTQDALSRKTRRRGYGGGSLLSIE